MDAADQNEVTVASRQSGLKKLNPYPHPTLESFWERPYPIAQETWTPSSKKIIHYISLPNDLFKIDPLWDKIRNFRFCNFDLEVSVRVNGTPFHYGQLMFAVIPNAMNGILGAKGRNNNFGPWENYYSLSGFEHILVSPTENQVQKLKIPYVLPKPFIDLEDLVSNSEVRRHIELLESEIAGIAVVPLAPLNSMGTPTNVSFTVFARIVNPVFTGFCSVLDANNRYSNFKRDIYVPRNEGFGELDMWVSTQIPVAPYSSGDSHIEPPPHMPYNFTAEFKADKEAVKKAENNCISDVLESAVSTVASIGLKALGTELGLFSMPNDVSGVVNIANKFPNLSNTHGTSAGYGMGIIPDNKVLPAASLLGSSAETMKITNIISRRALVCQFPIKSSHIDGDRIANLPVTPMLCHGKTAEVSKVPLCRIFHTPLSYVAKCFTYWRGDVIFHFDFICSNFHNARVRIGWIPKVSTQTRVGSIDESNYHNMIIDLASQTKVDFRVPYLNDEPFLDTRPSSWNGIVFVSLINAISYPNPTIPDIKVNVWISGADNFKFGMPIKSGTRRFVKQEGACAKSYGIRAYAAYNMEAQSGPENTQDTIIPAEEAYYNGFMFGEDVQHIKELCMRPYLTYSRRVAEKVAIGLEYLQNPWVVDTHTVCDQVDAVRTDTIGGFFSYFKMLFRFWRSSFTQRVYSDMKTEMLLSAVMTTSDGNYSDKIWASWDTASDSFRPMVDFVGNGTQLIRDIHNQVPSFHIPFYYNKPFVPSSAEYAGCPTYLDSSPSIYYKWFTGTAGTENIVHHYIMTNPSDDLEFGYQIGAPCEFMDSYDWNRRYPLVHSTIWRDDDPYFD
nr:TPA_asm: hypothetical protein [Dugejap virus 3]